MININMMISEEKMAFFLKSTFTTTVGVVIALGFLNTFADGDYYNKPCFDDENSSLG